MKLFIGLMIGWLLLFPNVADAEGIFNPQEELVIANRQLFSSFEKNKFAFNKHFSGKKVIVSGAVDSVGEDYLGDWNSPKLPAVHLQGLFYAFIVSQPTGFDLADFTPGDSFVAVCTDLQGGWGDVSIQAQCKPVFLAKPAQQHQSNNPNWDLFWLSSDQEVLQFALSPQMLEKIKTARQ